MDIDGILSYAPSPGIQNYAADRDKALSTEDDLRLKGACQEFEAVLTSIIMKEGLRSAQEAGKSISGDDDGDKGSQQYVEIANEQMAYFIGKRGMLGLGDSIYESVRNKMDREA